MLNTEFVKLLCCPETRQDLQPAEPALVAWVNQQISAGSIKNRAGQIVHDEIDAGLIRADRKLLFAIRHDIPVMLMEEAIPVP
jgi:uncharacterized protein YbaR (Trm112 family)